MLLAFVPRVCFPRCLATLLSLLLPRLPHNVHPLTFAVFSLLSEGSQDDDDVQNARTPQFDESLLVCTESCVDLEASPGKP